MKIGFLFNHYAGHQIFHSGPVAFALSNYPEVDVSIIVSDKKQRQTVEEIAQQWPNHKCTIKEAKVPLYAKILDAIIGKLVFIKKWAVLQANKHTFKPLDALVVPEETSLSLQKEKSLQHLKMIFIRHGAGDRDVGFCHRQRKFDLHLVAGQKVAQRLIDQAKVPQEKIKITGYAKFDTLQKEAPKPLFDNNNPIVLYNPHFKGGFSSYQTWGKEVLEFFKENTQYNLIFAPHVILYLRKWRHKAFPLTAYENCPNIHLDPGSERSLDMTYTRMADIYLGDVSSQVYEFLTKLRPCIFLNPHKLAWQEIGLKFWNCGPIIEDLSQLKNTLENAQKEHQTTYKATQQQLFDKTFSLTDEPSSHRGAKAIMEFLKQQSNN